jgi:flap endonuclease-1
MKKVAIDATVCIYQFLHKFTEAGTGGVLRGFLYRTLSILEAGYLPVYVFDGPKNPLKRTKHPPDYPYTDESIQLLECLGVPCFQAPQDAEAQCAVLSSKVDFISTTDLRDCFAFGAKKCGGDSLRGKISAKQALKRPFGMFTGKNKIRTLIFVQWLQFRRLPRWNREQYIEYRILLGTSYNKKLLPPHTGRPRAIKLIKEGSIEDTEYWTDVTAQIKDLYLNPPSIDLQENGFGLGVMRPNEMLVLLTQDHQFERSRVDTAIERIERARHRLKSIKTIDKWL